MDQTNPKSEPMFYVGQKVRPKSPALHRFAGEILERYQEENGDWFYTLDKRNYLHEPMLEAINA